MFCNQQRFDLPTEVVTAERFWALVRAPHTSELIDGYRATGDAALKRKLPAFIFQATFEETVSKKGNKGAWRCQAGSRLNGLCVMDVDHVESEELRMKSEEYAAADFPQKAKELGILLIYITPSGKGLKIVFKADVEKGNLIDNQHAMAKVLGVEVDESCKDASRMSFICKESDILYLDEELFTYENPDFGKKYDEAYRAGKSGATRPTPDPSRNGGEADAEEDPSNLPVRGDLLALRWEIALRRLALPITGEMSDRTERVFITVFPIQRLLKRGLVIRRLSRATGIGLVWCWPTTCDTSRITTLS